MKSYDQPSGSPSGVAAVRQTEKLSPAEPNEPLLPADREARVAKLRAQYQRGTYQVDPAELSADIVDKHLKK